MVLSGKIWEKTWLDNCWTPISLYLAVEGAERRQKLHLELKRGKEAYSTAVQNLQSHSPLVARAPSRRISIVVVQCTVILDGDAPSTSQAAQSLRPSCSNDQRVLRAAYYVRSNLFRASSWLLDILCGASKVLWCFS